jgi:hypothetical protein
MRHPRIITLSLTLCAIALVSAGCGSSGGKSDGGAAKAFLDKKKKLPPRLEWNTNVTSKSGGTFNFRVTSQGPFAVTIVTDAGYRAIQNKNQKGFNKADVLLTADSKGPTYEGKVTVPAGTSWFIIENQADKEVELHLQCFAP